MNGRRSGQNPSDRGRKPGNVWDTRRARPTLAASPRTRGGSANERTSIMGFDDALNKAKDLASENPEKAEQMLDGAGEQIKERTPDSVDGHVDSGVDAARDKFGLGGGDEKKGS